MSKIPDGTPITVPHHCGHWVAYTTVNWTEAMVAEKLTEPCPMCLLARSSNGPVSGEDD